MKKARIFTSVLAAGLAAAPSAWAQNLGTDLLNSAAGPNGAGYQATPLATMIGSFIGVVLGLLSIIFFLYTLYAGFLWMTAAGDSKQVDGAKDILRRAVVGLAIMLSAYAITQFVLANIAVVSNGSTPANVGGI